MQITRLAFNKTLTLPQPFALSPITSSSYRQQRHTYWFHPDHLGSSSYISNINGRISQHIEYFPFGETLVGEHKNSNNSPYKFNGKMLDAETGNYYYGARYYNPKWSLWLSVDPLAENYPGWSSYNYTLYNPVRFVDPDGRSVAMPDDWFVNDKTGELLFVKGAETVPSKYGNGWNNIGEDNMFGKKVMYNGTDIIKQGSFSICGTENTQSFLNKRGFSLSKKVNYKKKTFHSSVPEPGVGSISQISTISEEILGQTTTVVKSQKVGNTYSNKPSFIEGSISGPHFKTKYYHTFYGFNTLIQKNHNQTVKTNAGENIITTIITGLIKMLK